MPTTSQTELLAKIQDRTAVIGIVGLGYVGLPLMLRFIEVGYRVLGIDVDPAKVEALNRGESQIEHIPSEAIKSARQTGSSRPPISPGRTPPTH